MSTPFPEPPAQSATPNTIVVERPAIRNRGRRHRGLIRLGIPVIVVILAGGSVAYMSSQRGSAITEPTIFHVKHRDLAVVLEEKGELKAAKSVSIKCEVEGRSTIIWLIEEGSEVQEGDLLVRLASDQIDERVRTEEIRLANATASAESAEKEHEILIGENASDIRKGVLALQLAAIELEKYTEGDSVQQHMAAELALKLARKILERAVSELQDSRDLYEGRDDKIITKGEFLTAEFNFDEAEVAVKKAELALQILIKYTHPKDLQQKQSNASEAEKDLERTRKGAEAREAKSRANLEAKRAELDLTRQRLDKYRQQQGRTEILAPSPGLVVYDTGTSRYDRRQISEGVEVYERQGIIKLPDPSLMQVSLRIHESKSNAIKIGQSALVEVEGLPGQWFTGTVTRISSVADSRNSWLNPNLKEYETEITLDPSDQPLKPGMTATAKIMVEQLGSVLAIPVQAVYSRGSRHFVFRGSSRSVEAVQVELGSASSEFIEVRAGLSEGDPILLAVSDDFIRLLPELTEAERDGNEFAAHSTTQKAHRPKPTAKPSRDREGAVAQRGSGGKRPLPNGSGSDGGTGSSDGDSSSQSSGGKSPHGKHAGGSKELTDAKKPNATDSKGGAAGR